MTGGITRGANRIIYGTSDTRMRAVWRISVAIILSFAGALLGVALLRYVAVGELFVPVVGHFFAVLGVLSALVVVGRYIDDREIPEYGFRLSRRWVIELCLGTVLGIGLVGLAFAVSYRQGSVTVIEVLSAGTARSFAFGIGVVVLGWSFVAFWEETLLRSLFFKNAAEGLAARDLTPLVAVFGAWLSSSVVYGFLHGPLGSNPESVSLLYALVMTVVMGGLFGIAYALSGELALPIGLHLGINFAEHNLFFGPPEAVTPAVLRVARTGSGGYIQFQSIEPVVIVPVFAFGYLCVIGWSYLRDGTISQSVQT
jgi:membrane protease YdiL (CAAX protease family)